MTDKRLKKIVETKIQQRASFECENYESELLMKQANITALQAQINPHFLYNALECIRAQAIMEGSNEIATVSQALSLFFRYNISSTNDLITLKDEFENVKNYILIQQFRFQDRITVETDYDINDKEIMEVLLPKLVLQPIIENSIIHGFEDMTSGAKITIAVERTQNHITIKISDNGKGMDIHQLNEIKKRLISPIQTNYKSGENSKNGIALNNVNRRLELFFGKEYGMNLYSCKGEGTDVELFLPLQLSLKQENAN